MPPDTGLNFTLIPGLVERLLTGASEQPPRLRDLGFGGQRFRQVVTLFIDAFGWCFAERFQDHPLLRRFARDGQIFKLRSQFPSTTSAHVTTLYTGLPVSQHGIYEWFYYEPLLDGMIAPLLFAWAGDDKRESLAQFGIQGAQLYPQGKMAEKLDRQGVASYIFQPGAFFESTFSRQMGHAAHRIPTITPAEGMATISELLPRLLRPAWIVNYLDSFDSVCHIHGPHTPQSDAELETLLSIIERWLTRNLLGSLKNSLVMIIADHGQVRINPKNTLYLDQMPAFAQLKPLLRTSRRGDILAPAGSCRDFFVYAKEESIAEAEAVLAAMVGSRGEVRRAVHLVEQGCFGPPPISKALQDRLGNLVVLPFEGESVFWWGDGHFEQKFCGHHGGLTPLEMEIPLLLLPVD